MSCYTVKYNKEPSAILCIVSAQPVDRNMHTQLNRENTQLTDHQLHMQTFATECYVCYNTFRDIN